MDEPVVNEREKEHAEQLVKDGVPIPEWWFKDNALLTFQFNASSATVPEGERFIVKAADDARKVITDEGLKKRAETLMHEETAHASVHDAYNRYLNSMGFPAKKYNDETKKLNAFFERIFSLKMRLSVCAMIEHFTDIFSKNVLELGILEGEDTDERMDRVWSWHCIEEVEHRSTAFDLHKAIGGGYWSRVSGAIFASFLFAIVHTRCFLAFLNAKKLLWNRNTWKKGWPYILGKRGVYRPFLTYWILYFKPGFHPTQIPIENRFKKQLHHYHIESELLKYFPPES